jgi:HD-GYP domain-containing protein (c-di-GMP phosphodiesterase class II)
MSSDPPSVDPSRAEPAPGAGLAETLRVRGEPLLEALDRHLPGARGHAESTATYAFAAAAELGFDRDRCEVARDAARMHEVGRVYGPDADQYEAGYRLARGAGIPEEACTWLLRMRESFDGSGPESLAGEAIPIESRLMRATCVLHTELSAAASQGAIERLEAEAGTTLDPRVVEALVAILKRAAP